MADAGRARAGYGVLMLQRFGPDATTDALIKTIDRDGAVIVEGLIDDETLRAINNEVDPYVEAADPAAKQINPALDFFFGKRTRHVASLTGKSPTFARAVLCHPTILGVCDEILLPACARYHLNIASIIDRGPGADMQMLHRDEDVWVHVPKPHPELQVASIWSLVDIDKAMGATAVVPGSHRWDRTRQPSPEEIDYAEMPAGSAVFYLGSVIHAGGANVTESTWRRAVHLSYCLGWLRTEENNYLGTPPSVAKHLPRQAQELVGYAAHDAIADMGGYLGILDGRDPVEMLQDGSLA
jgi:ectoine hydroxylase-related dioxygenase (phytanoyl-CoA dioxygenase family)